MYIVIILDLSAVTGKCKEYGMFKKGDKVVPADNRCGEAYTVSIPPRNTKVWGWVMGLEGVHGLRRPWDFIKVNTEKE